MRFGLRSRKRDLINQVVKRKTKRTELEIIAFIIVLIYFVYTIIFSQVKSISAKTNKLEQLQSGIKQETEYNSNLKDTLNNVNSEGSVKDTARQELGMLQDNERVFVDSNK